MSNNQFFSRRFAARTFGHHLFKRLSFAIIPTAFVVGIIMTLLAALTVISIKSLGVGVSKGQHHLQMTGFACRPT